MSDLECQFSDEMSGYNSLRLIVIANHTSDTRMGNFTDAQH